MNKEKLSHGGAIHRRRVLAKERASLEYLKEIITDTENTAKRAMELGKLLKNNSLDPEKRILFIIEKTWADYRLGRTNDGEKMSIIDRELNKVKKKNPKVYEFLKTPDETGLNPIAKIRNRYFRPTKHHF